MEHFSTPKSINIIGTLRIVIIEIYELTFFLILNFHGKKHQKTVVIFLI